MNITLVQIDKQEGEWEGLYVNRNLLIQAPSLTATDVVMALRDHSDTTGTNIVTVFGYEGTELPDAIEDIECAYMNKQFEDEE